MEDSERREIEPNRGKCVFVLGGSRSGKSSFALKEAEKAEGTKVYIATAEALDDEMKNRIARHRQERADGWETLEEPLRISEALGSLPDGCGSIVLDCLTIWLSNALHRKADIIAETEKLLAAVNQKKAGSHIYIVSNEVGTGIVPENRLAREFRDLAGTLNQMVAGAADEVYMVIAGLPVKIKG